MAPKSAELWQAERGTASRSDVADLLLCREAGRARMVKELQWEGWP